jgi:hypothetical protein
VNLLSARARVDLSTKQLNRDKETPMSPRFRTWAAITGTAAVAALSLLIPTAAGAAQTPATPPQTLASTSVAPHASHVTGSPIKVTRQWSLSALGSGEAVLGCPEGYGLQWNAIKTPNFGSSNSAISATLVGYDWRAATLWVTNWTFKSQTTTLHVWCEPI